MLSESMSQRPLWRESIKLTKLQLASPLRLTRTVVSAVEPTQSSSSSSSSSKSISSHSVSTWCQTSSSSGSGYPSTLIMTRSLV